MSNRHKIMLVGAVLIIAILLMRGRLMKNIEWTARIAWGEARSEGREGLHAVVNVIDNRARMDLFNDNKPDWWGETHAGVATQPWQFSAYNENDPNRAKLEAVTDEDANFVTAVELAAQAVAGSLPDITGGATHYHTVDLYPRPNWVASATPTVRIGNHQFYKDVA